MIKTEFRDEKGQFYNGCKSKRLLNVNVDKIKELYLEKRLSGENIAKILGVSSSVVFYRLKKEGIPRRNQSETTKRYIQEHPEFKREIKLDKEYLVDRYVKKGWSTLKISKEVSHGASVINSYLKKYGIPMRGVGRYKGFRLAIQKEELIKAYLDEKRDMVYLGNKYGVSYQCIKRRLKYYKIPLRKFEGNNGTFKKGDEELKNRVREWRKYYILPIKDTSIEVKIQNFLKSLGIDFFTHQYMKEIEHGYQCDILVPSMNLVIECDGDYWHKYPTGRDIDKIRTSELLQKGFKVLRLWESEINNMDLNKFLVRIQNV